MTWITEHREKTIKHMLWLRERDADYARHALKTYLALENCPCPDIADEIRRRWKECNEKNQNTAIESRL